MSGESVLDIIHLIIIIFYILALYHFSCTWNPRLVQFTTSLNMLLSILHFVCHMYNYGLRCIGDAFRNIVQEISILLVRKRSLKKSSRGFLTISCKIKLKKFLFSFKMIVTCQNLIEEHHRLRNGSSTD